MQVQKGGAGGLADGGRSRALRARVLGALLQMMSGMGAGGRAATWDEIETTLARFETQEAGFVGPCEMLVGSGTR